jgi:hypothetical protein
MTETVNRVVGDIVTIPRETVGLKLSTSGGIAGDVSALKPRKEELPAITASVKLSGKTVVCEVVQKLNDSGEVVRHEKVPPYSFLTQL